MKFLNLLVSHLNLVSTIATAVQTMQSIGHSKETTLQKVVGIVETAATLGESVPVPQVAAISGLVETIVEGVFGQVQVPTTTTTTTITTK